MTDCFDTDARYKYSEPALSSVKAVGKPIWKKLPTFGRAIAYMLTKGESEKIENQDWQDILNSLPSGAFCDMPSRLPSVLIYSSST